MGSKGSLSKKILIVRFSSIGDIVLTTPVIRCMHEQIPGYEFHFLTKKKYDYLISDNPHISKLFCFEKSTHEVLSELKKENYSLIIDLQKNYKTFILKQQLGKPSFSFSKINILKWMAVRLKINKLPDKHIVDRMFEGLKKLGIQYDKQGLDYYQTVDITLPDFAKEFTENHTDFFVFSIGGTYFTKRCPNEKVIEICNRLERPVILTGGPTDVTNGEKISEQLICPHLNLTGAISVGQSALLVEMSNFVISNDTGMMHIAAALKKPIVSLWGNTIPEFGMTPLLPDGFFPQPAIIEVGGLKCRPCSKLGYHTCPKKHFRCMKEIEPENITKYLESNKLLKQ